MSEDLKWKDDNCIDNKITMTNMTKTYNGENETMEILKQTCKIIALCLHMYTHHYHIHIYIFIFIHMLSPIPSITIHPIIVIQYWIYTRPQIGKRGALITNSYNQQFFSRQLLKDNGHFFFFSLVQCKSLMYHGLHTQKIQPKENDWTTMPIGQIN